MRKIRQVQFRMKSWSGQRSKDDGSLANPVNAAANLMSRSMSLNSLSDDRPKTGELQILKIF
ncbi:hypothetical protein X975_05997, partial [Stegodyphus mimosarum]